MVSKHELRSYQDGRWASCNLILGSILAAAVLMMAVVGATLTPKPYVDQGGVDISASQKHSDTAFALMSRAPANIPVEIVGASVLGARVSLLPFCPAPAKDRLGLAVTIEPERAGRERQPPPVWQAQRPNSGRV